MLLKGSMAFDEPTKMYAVSIPILGVYTQGIDKDEAFEMAKSYLEEGYENLEFDLHWISKEQGTFFVDSEDSFIFAIILKNARENLGLSLPEAALKLGFKNHNSIYAYEQGKRIPSVQNLSKILLGYGVNIIVDFSKEDMKAG